MTLAHRIQKVRAPLYRSARILGDLQAIASGSPAKIRRRVERRVVGRLFGRKVMRRLP